MVEEVRLFVESVVPRQAPQTPLWHVDVPVEQVT
jgi:hypothetical protein